MWFVSYKMLTPTPGRTRTNLSATRKSTLHTSQLRDNFYRTLLSSRTRGARRTTAPRAGFNSFLFSKREQHAPRACTRRRRALRDAGFSGGWVQQVHALPPQNQGRRPRAAVARAGPRRSRPLGGQHNPTTDLGEADHGPQVSGAARKGAVPHHRCRTRKEAFSVGGCTRLRRFC